MNAQIITHYFLHLGFPFLIAYFFFYKEWRLIYLILLATMLVDLDHLFSLPIFQADRCSIHFHPLHSYYAILIYVAMLFFKRPFNIIGIGLLLHMFTDLMDCIWMFAHCQNCLASSPAVGLLTSISKFLGI